MISFSEGRELRDLDSRFYEAVRGVVEKYDQPIFAISGLNKGTPEEYRCMIQKARDGNPSTKIFVGTNAFKAQPRPVGGDVSKIYWKEALDAAVRPYWDAVLSEADIISFSDGELSQTAGIFSDRFSDLEQPANAIQRVTEKLRQARGKNPIVVCHSAAGAIMSYDGLPKDTAQHALEMAVHGASLRCARGRYGTESEITDFGAAVGRRSYPLFNEIMGCSPGKLPPGIVGVVAPDLGNGIKGSITGAGATFDGILVNYVAPLIKR